MRRPPCTSRARPRSAGDPPRSCAPGCRRCDRSGRGRETPRPAAAGSAARIHEVDRRKGVLHGDLLRPEMLLQGDRVIGAAFHRRVVRDDDDLAARDAAHSRHEARAGRGVLVETPARERRDLEKGGSRIEKALEALADEKLAARDVPRALLLSAAFPGLRELAAQARGERAVVGGILPELRRGRGELRDEDFAHARSPARRRMASTVAPVVVPGRKMSRTPRALSGAMSFSGMIPPTTTAMLSPPLSFKASITSGTRTLWAPDRIERPTTSTSSWTAAAAICRGVCLRPE